MVILTSSKYEQYKHLTCNYRDERNGDTDLFNVELAHEVLLLLEVLELREFGDLLNNVLVVARVVCSLTPPVVVEALYLFEDAWVQTRTSVGRDLLAAREKGLDADCCCRDREDVERNACDRRVRAGMPL